MTAAALTLPGAIPGLLRRGSPVVVVSGRWAGRLGVVVSIRDGEADVALDAPEAGGVLTFALDELALDLRCDTGRAHAAWWLGEPGCGTPRTFARGRRRVVCLWVNGIPYIAHPGGCGRLINQGAVIVPALADLDPDDPRTLPDGSRWVDAEALRRVVLHVAGLPL